MAVSTINHERDAKYRWRLIPEPLGTKYTVDDVEYTVALHRVSPGGWHWRLLYRQPREAPGFPHMSRD